jgi:CHAD domain-containing protein
MAYRIKRSKPLASEVRRIAVEQIDRALARYASPEAPSVAVHETRKHLKRTRALLRLVRFALADATYRRENVRLRDIGRMLSRQRDLDVMAEALARLETRCELAPDGPARALHGALAAARAAAAKSEDTPPAEEAIKRLRSARRALARLPLAEDGFAPLARGLEKTYRACREAHAALKPKPSDEELHELRKRLQQHWRHLALLSAAWPDMMRARAGAARELSDLLGTDQDLARLAEFVAGQTGKVLSKAETGLLLGSIAEWRAELAALARPRAERLLAEGAGGLSRRIARYWEIAADVREPRKGAGEETSERAPMGKQRPARRTVAAAS